MAEKVRRSDEFVKTLVTYERLGSDALWILDRLVVGGHASWAAAMEIVSQQDRGGRSDGRQRELDRPRRRPPADIEPSAHQQLERCPGDNPGADIGHPP